MIDVGLLVLMVILGVTSFVMGWVFCAIFHNNKEDDLVHPCETLKDIVGQGGIGHEGSRH